MTVSPFYSDTAQLDVHALEVWRGDKRLLRDVNLCLKAGQLGLLTGPNGCGKTSLMRILLGLVWPEQGTVRWCNQPIEGNADYRAAMAYVGHHGAITDRLDAGENLRFAASLMAQPPRLSPQDALAQVGLAQVGRRAVQTFSAGQRRRLALARLLMSPAQLWYLDEPLTNLDTAGVALVTAVLDAHLNAGGMAVVASHQAIECQPEAIVALELGSC